MLFVRTQDKDGNEIQAGRIAESVKVKVEFEDANGKKVRQKVDIGGFNIVPPKKQQ